MRARIIIAIVALGAAVIAAGASANLRSINDPRGDVRCTEEGVNVPCSDQKRRNADIVRATAGHGKNGRLKHTIRVVGKFKHGRLELNTDLSNQTCEWRMSIDRGVGSARVQRCHARPRSIGRARYDFHRHSVSISFSKESIGNPHRYGWRAFVESGPASDVVPKREDYIQHRLG
jgi:hypothetical protein